MTLPDYETKHRSSKRNFCKDCANRLPGDKCDAPNHFEDNKISPVTGMPFPPRERVLIDCEMLRLNWIDCYYKCIFWKAASPMHAMYEV